MLEHAETLSLTIGNHAETFKEPKTMTDQQNETIIANVSASDFGAKAIAQWKSRDASGAKGDAAGFMAVILAFETMSFTATWETTEDKTKRTHRLDFDLKDYMLKSCNKADGSRDNKATQARTLAVFKKVFGVDEPTSAQSQSLRRCVEMVQHALDKGLTSDDFSINSKGYLEVPYQLMHDKPSEKASDRERKVYEKMADESQALDNKEGMSVAAFKRRIAPKTERAGQAAGSSEGAASPVVSFMASVKHVADCVEQIVSTDESDVALTKANEEELFALGARINAYFAKFPKEEKGKTRKAA